MMITEEKIAIAIEGLKRITYDGKESAVKIATACLDEIGSHSHTAPEPLSKPDSVAGQALISTAITPAIRDIIQNINSDTGEGWKPKDEEGYWADLLKAATVAPPASAAPVDPIVELNVAMLRQRSAVGIAKYGTTLEDNPLDLAQWLQHALEESLDLANYLQAAIQKL